MANKHRHRDILIGTSKALQKHSHGKNIDAILQSAIEVIEYVKSKGLEVRFSSEDSFRSDLVDLLTIYKAVDKIGVDRVGVADTIGCATPRQVYDLVRTLRGVVCKSRSPRKQYVQEYITDVVRTSVRHRDSFPRRY